MAVSRSGPIGGAEVQSVSTVHAQSMRRVIVAASVGTIFEWYDFTLYGSLASVIAKTFFAAVDPTTGFIFALLTFGIGFVIRPFGALVFGPIGDKIGRKRTFLATIVIMGLATVGVGLLPGYNKIGIAAPILLLSLRMLQGLALGGEYGGAATYVAEHSSKRWRGLNTSWISSTGALGLLLSFVVILVVRTLSGEQFDVWGWRLPFLFSLVLLGVSLWIRMRTHESPAFQALKRDSGLSGAPLSETFLEWKNLKRLLVGLFGICAGMTVVYYTSALYPTFFLVQTLKVDPREVTGVVTLATLTCMPLFIGFGWLCDVVGRKPVLLGGFLLAGATLFPIFHAMTAFANPALARAQRDAPVVLETDTSQCSFMFNPIGSRHFSSPCDVAKQALSAAGVSYAVRSAGPGSPSVVSVGPRTVHWVDDASHGAAATFNAELRQALNAAGYPEKADPATFNKPAVFALLFVLLISMAATVVPTFPALIELFPTRIRYTSISFPYHFASGWIGGLLPTFSFALSAQNGNIFFGLWYPMAWLGFSFIVALLFLPETRNVDIDASY